MLDNAVHNTDFRNYFTSDTTKDSQFLSNFCKKFSDMAIFSDSSEEFSQFPDWVNFLIKFGFRWPAGESKKRRIALVSMPCDSPAAGLISLGALIRDLKNPKANAFDGHVVSIRHYAEQYLNYCNSHGNSRRVITNSSRSTCYQMVRFLAQAFQQQHYEFPK